MKNQIELCSSCPLQPTDTQPADTMPADCEGPITAVDAVTVTGFSGLELRGAPNGERRICGRDGVEPATGDAYTIFTKRDGQNDRLAITTYGDAAQRISDMTSSEQQRLAKTYTTDAERDNIAPLSLRSTQPMKLRLVQTDAERARSVGGFEADTQVAEALLLSEQVATEVHGLLHSTLEHTRVQESVHALAMINTILHRVPELREIDAKARRQIEVFLGKMGILGSTSPQYKHYAQWAEGQRAPFNPLDVSSEPTVLVLKQRIAAAGHMLRAGHFDGAHLIARRRAEVISGLLNDLEDEEARTAIGHIHQVSEDIAACKEKVADLVMQLGVVRAQY